MEDKNILEGLDLQGIENLIGEAQVVPEEPVHNPDVISGMTISMDVEQVKVDEPTYNLNIPADAVSFALIDGDLDDSNVIIDEQFVKDYFKAQKLYESIGNQLEDAKIFIKNFIEAHDTGSISSNGMEVKYTPATTTTTIDSAKLKKEFPEIAAQCSKTSPRKSSISIKEVK